MKKIILILFFIHMMVLSYFNNVYVAGVPLRSFILVFIGLLVLVEGSSYFTDLKVINTVYSAIVLIGIIVSLYNSMALSDMVMETIRLFQSYLIIITVYYLTINFNYKTVPYVVIAIAVPSAIVGLFQFLDLDFAWKLREIVGGLSNTANSQLATDSFIEVHARPPGLALFAIMQAYMLITGIIMSLFLFIRAYESRESTQWYLLLTGILFLGCVASETRSVIGASAVLIMLTLMRVNLSRSILIGTFLILIFSAAQFQKQKNRVENSDSRLMSLEDQSAKGRITLYKYGLELAIKNPIGYGYGFDSIRLAHGYFMNDRNIFNYSIHEKGQFLVPIHNTILNIFHVFGIAGFIVFVYYIVYLARIRWFFRYALIGYFINGFFHNDGILMGDLYIDFFIGIIMFYRYQIDSSNLGTPTVEKKSNPAMSVASYR